MTLKFAGSLILIGCFFLLEVFFLNQISTSFNLEFSLSSQKTIEKLKVCGIIQLILLFITGVLIYDSDNSAEIRELKKRITRMENAK